MPVFLISARGLCGLGGGGIMPVVQTVTDVVEPARARPVSGSLQQRVDGGRNCRAGSRRVSVNICDLVDDLLINLPLALAALALLLPKMKKIPVFHRRRKVDCSAASCWTASAVVFMLVLTWGGNRYLWLSPVIVAMLGHPLRSPPPSSGTPATPKSQVPAVVTAGRHGRALRDGRRRLQRSARSSDRPCICRSIMRWSIISKKRSCLR